MNTKRFALLALPVLLVVSLILTVGCAAEEIEAPTQIVENVTAQEAFTLIQDNQNNPDFVILDVRTPEEFADGHIEKAINMDFYSETFRDELNKLDKNKAYLLHCRSGNRSGKTLNIMKELKFMKIYHMTGGMIKWEAEGLPIIK